MGYRLHTSGQVSLVTSSACKGEGAEGECWCAGLQGVARSEHLAALGATETYDAATLCYVVLCLVDNVCREGRLILVLGFVSVVCKHAVCRTWGTVEDVQMCQLQVCHPFFLFYVRT